MNKRQKREKMLRKKGSKSQRTLESTSAQRFREYQAKSRATLVFGIPELGAWAVSAALRRLKARRQIEANIRVIDGSTGEEVGEISGFIPASETIWIGGAAIPETEGGAP